MTAKPESAPPLMPWYVHLIGGHALTGLVPWLLVSRQLWHRGRPGVAFAVFSTNILLLACISLFGIYSHLAWDQLLLISYMVNLVWSVAAWILQRFLYGSAPKRYLLCEWRSWISPLLIALITGICLSVIASFFPIIGERFKMIATHDMLDKKVILWDFFQAIPLFLPYSFLVGIWWAGERRRFSPAHILTYLAGLSLFLLLITLLSTLFMFLFFKGEFGAAMTESSMLIPPGLQGLKLFLIQLSKQDMSSFVLLPLLLGAAPRIRDFWKRALAIIPALCLCFFSLSFYSPETWQVIQNQFLYEMSSPDQGSKKRAHNWAETMLNRFPNHDNWPDIAGDLARNSYENGDYAAAKTLYQQLADRYQNSPRWFIQSDIAKGALASETFGSPQTGPTISMPLLSFETYMSRNWMALLKVIRYYAGKDIPESEILIKLKGISKNDNKIKLPPIPNLAELDDCASNLGLELLILPTDITVLRDLLQQGVPIIQPVYDYFYLFHGIDDTRSVVMGSFFDSLSRRLKEGDRNEIREILSLQQEGEGKSQKQQAWIAAQTSVEIPFSFWDSPLQHDTAPFMAVLYPAEKLNEIAKTLNKEQAEITQKSQGYLAAMISLNALKSGDPVQCINWAQLSSQLIPEPFPLYIAHLAEQFWQTREKLSQSHLALEKHLPELAALNAFFNKPENRTYLDKAARQFKADQLSDDLPWIIRNQHQDFLDRSDPLDLAQLIESVRHDVDKNPAHRAAWLSLASLYEWQDNVEKMIGAYEGALQSGAWDNDIALQLTYAYVQTNHQEKARKIFNKLGSDKMKFEAHYYFCKAAVAKWDGKPGKALRYYKKAIKMRRYIPLYHLDYAKLLLEQGHPEEAAKALDWAKRIDARGAIRDAADKLLSGLKKT